MNAAVTDARWWAIALALLVYGIGVGFATAQVTNVVLTDVPLERAGQAAGVQSAARQLGSALGIAVLTTAFYSTVEASVTSGLQHLGTVTASKFAQAITDSAGSILPTFTRPELLDVARVGREALTHGVAAAAALAAAFLLVGLAATALIRRPAGAAPTRPSTEATTETPAPVRD